MIAVAVTLEIQKIVIVCVSSATIKDVHSKNNSEFCSFCSVKLPDKEYRCCERCREQKRKYNANRQLKKKLGFTKIREKLLGKENDTALLCNWEYHVTEIEKKQFCRTFKEKIHPIDKLIDKYEKQRLTKKLRNFLSKAIPYLIGKEKNFRHKKNIFTSVRWD